MFNFFKQEVFVIGDHEVIECKSSSVGAVPSKKYYKCKRCNEKSRNGKEYFKEINCHNCNCGRCDI